MSGKIKINPEADASSPPQGKMPPPNVAGAALGEAQAEGRERGGLDRTLERAIDRSERIRPAFSGSWVAPDVPGEAEVLHTYELPGCSVRICRLPASTEGLYHVTPEEYRLADDELGVILDVRDAIRGDFPEGIELTNVSQVRQYVARRAGDLLADHQARHHLLKGGPDEVRAKLARLTRILERYTVGYGVLEILLTDPHVSDVYVNAPSSTTPVRVTLHTRELEGAPQKCQTNINLGEVDEESILSRLRYESGRPFNESFPVLEADLPSFGTRATLVGPPLSPRGMGVAFRRHAPDPWTLPRLIAAGSMNPLTAGLLSVLIQGQSTIIVAGGRGAGKTSLLAALLFEIPRGQRIITVEDTPEIPILALQSHGYQVQALGVQSSLGGKSEMTADDALRVGLRLGESAIVMGEVRGQEARTLYESMRAGAAGSTVLGTFHGDSAKAVHQRVVYDMGIPPNSFAATDAVVIAGTVRRGGGAGVERRLLQIAEFDKRNPEAGDFHDLLRYDVSKSDWTVTEEFQRSSFLLSSIGARWGFNYFEVMGVVEARASVYAHMVRRAKELGRPELLGAGNVARVCGVLQEYVRPGLDADAVADEVTGWFDREIART